MLVSSQGSEMSPSTNGSRGEGRERRKGRQMTNTMQDNTTTTTQEKRNFDVQYTLEIVDDLPPKSSGGGGGGGKSVLEEKLEELKGREDAHGKWVLIGKYGKATAAGAAANVLRQRHGRNANAEGYEFAYRKIDQDGSTVNGLFVKFDPTAIVPGALEQHRAEEAARLEKLKAAADERKAKEGAVAGDQTGGEGVSEDKVAEAKAKAAAAAKKAAK